MSIPRIYCLLRKEFLYDGEAHHESTSRCVFAASIHGRRRWLPRPDRERATFWRLPIHALATVPMSRPCLSTSANLIVSATMSVTCFDRPARCVRAYLKDRLVSRQVPVHDRLVRSEDAEEAGEGGQAPTSARQRQLRGPAQQLPAVARPAFVTPHSERPDFRSTPAPGRSSRGLTTDGHFYDDPPPRKRWPARSIRSLGLPRRMHPIARPPEGLIAGSGTPVVRSQLISGASVQGRIRRCGPRRGGRIRLTVQTVPPASFVRSSYAGGWLRSIAPGRHVLVGSESRGVSANCFHRRANYRGSAASSSMVRRALARDPRMAPPPRRLPTRPTAGPPDDAHSVPIECGGVLVYPGDLVSPITTGSFVPTAVAETLRLAEEKVMARTSCASWLWDETTEAFKKYGIL